jgi:hypothetical protein
MDLLLIAVVIIAAVVLLAQVAKRRKPEAPTQTTNKPPDQLDRRDFARPDAPWLAVVWTSETCVSCADVVPKVQVLESSDVAVEVVPFQARTELHRRYKIESVPTTLLTDADGVVQKAFVGPISATDLWAAMAELREPGSTPPPEAHTRI